EMNQAGTVRGFVGADEDVRRLVAAGAETNAVAVRPWPQCEAMLTLDKPLAAADGLSAQLRPPGRRCPGGTLCDGDRMVVEVRMPTHPAHLYLAYVQATGDMVMLEQPAGAAPAPRRPGTMVTIGDGPGQSELRVSGP